LPAGRGRIGERIFAPAAIIVLLAGIGLMLEGSWDWGVFGVDFALVAFAASFLVGIAVLSPMAKKLEVIGPTTPEGLALTRRIFAILRVDIAFLFAIVFAMTVKPTWDDLGVVLGAAAVLVVLSAVFLARASTGRHSFGRLTVVQLGEILGCRDRTKGSASWLIPATV
jgi:hypothetical protein